MTTFFGQGSSFGVRGKRKAELSSVLRTSGAQSERQSSQPSQAQDACVKTEVRKRTTVELGKPGRLHKYEQWLEKELGIKTYFFTVNTKTKEKAYCHAALHNEMGQMLPGGKSDGRVRAG